MALRRWSSPEKPVCSSVEFSRHLNRGDRYEKSRFNDSQIMSILKQAEAEAEAEAGTPVAELCREHGMSSASFYKWRSRFGGMDASMMTRLKELEDENRRLKKM